MHAQQIEAWKSLDVSANVYVAYSLQDERIHFESSAEQALPDDLPQEAVIRVFTNVEDAVRYCDVLTEYHRVSFVAMQIKLRRLFQTATETRRHAKEPVRYDLCAMPQDEHPRAIVNIHSDHELVH